MKYLITGTSSGLGRYLLEELDDAIAFNREGNNVCKCDTIIHCGWNTSNANINNYIEDAITLTEHLLSIEYRHFIFISTIDVYPKDNNIHFEDEQLSIDNLEPYAQSKLIVENLIKQKATSYTILRLSSLLGKYTRSNNSTKLIHSEDISISKQSTFNYILYEQILEIIKHPKFNQILNVVGINNVDFQYLCTKYNININDKAFVYKTPKIDTTKLQLYYPHLCSLSEDNFHIFRTIHLDFSDIRNLPDVIKKYNTKRLIVAEVGVNRGDLMNTYSNVIKNLNGTIYAIDWFLGQKQIRVADTSVRNHYLGYGYDFYNEFLDNIQNKDIINILKGKTTEMAKLISDKSLDICYIDADHSYLGCLADLKAFLPKIKPGGIICGDDYDSCQTYPNYALEQDAYMCTHPGVVKAVNEMFINSNLEIRGNQWLVKIC